MGSVTRLWNLITGKTLDKAVAEHREATAQTRNVIDKRGRKLESALVDLENKINALDDNKRSDTGDCGNAVSE